MFATYGSARAVNVAYAVDVGVMELLQRSMHSIYAFATPETRARLVFHILHPPTLDLGLLRASLPGARIESYPLTGFGLRITPAVHGYTARDTALAHKLNRPSNFWRFQLPTLLPYEDRVLYLDTDTVVLCDIATIYDNVLR